MVEMHRKTKRNGAFFDEDPRKIQPKISQIVLSIYLTVMNQIYHESAKYFRCNQKY